ncbi:MAG TPA: hypothetical protein VEW74_05695 [Candidatus Nitrosotalea sp.]|nr:hypothetical protein [Candidatus Nitrosotalea sp.]
MELRPLGFGEIFDRAVTLYLRNFVPFAGIVMVLVVPLAILQYIIDRNTQPQFDMMIRIFQHPEVARDEQMPSYFSSPAMVLAFVAVFILTYAVWPFVLNAVAVGVARLYRGRPVEFRACYAVALARWKQILGVVAVEFLVIIGWYMVTVVIALVIVLGAVLLGTAAPQIAVLLGVIAVLVVLILMLPVLAPLVVALTFSMYATVIEERPVMESVRLGFARVFNRTEFWRALLLSIATGAIVLGASTTFSALSIVAAIFHLTALRAIIETIPQLVISPFGIVLLAIYYFDVRIRREAYDLEASLERLTAAQPA